jgi:hypothetical protein
MKSQKNKTTFLGGLKRLESMIDETTKGIESGEIAPLSSDAEAAQIRNEIQEIQEMIVKLQVKVAETKAKF